jgi:ribosomal protein S18 acetylase RimI-like enzyme
VNIVITEIDSASLQCSNQCHEPFMVDAVLSLSLDGEVIRHAIVHVAPYQKRYPPNEIDYADYIGKADQTVFFAHADGELAGELVLRRWWNGFGYIEDLAVKAAFNRRGVGSALVQSAVAWAKDRRLPGLMLETQNNNVPACLFYAQCGFQLGGFDRYLYRALQPGTQEIALYWYLLLPA